MDKSLNDFNNISSIQQIFLENGIGNKKISKNDFVIFLSRFTL
jgi:hypothetical protein